MKPKSDCQSNHATGPIPVQSIRSGVGIDPWDGFEVARDTSVQNARTTFAESAQMMCRVGSGVVLNDVLAPNLPTPLLRMQIQEDLPTLPSGVVLLTPPTTSHPVLNTRVQRSVFDGRTFSVKLQPGSYDGAGAHFVVKGGDPFYREGIGNAVERLALGQAPGFGKADHNGRGFRAGALLHEFSLETTGELASLPVPHSVRRIDTVPGVDGKQVPIREFMNSSEYIRLTPIEAIQLDLPRGVKLGDYLLDERGVVPSELLYLINGPTLRCSELLNLLVFDERTELPANDPIRVDYECPPSGKSICAPFGERLLIDIPSHDEIIRRTYKLLGGVWGVPLEEALPSEPVTQENYGRVLPEIRKRIEREMAGLILEPMAYRIFDTLALAHSQGLSFSSRSKFAGSAHPTNVTISGILCDLGEVRAPQDGTTLFEKDFAEAVLTMAMVSRALAFTTPKPFVDAGWAGQVGSVVDELMEVYLHAVEQHTEGDIAQRRLLSEAISRNRLHVPMSRLFS